MGAIVTLESDFNAGEVYLFRFVSNLSRLVRVVLSESSSSESSSSGKQGVG
jgi:hypothetical protein